MGLTNESHRSWCVESEDSAITKLRSFYKTKYYIVSIWGVGDMVYDHLIYEAGDTYIEWIGLGNGRARGVKIWLCDKPFGFVWLSFFFHTLLAPSLILTIPLWITSYLILHILIITMLQKSESRIWAPYLTRQTPKFTLSFNVKVTILQQLGFSIRRYWCVYTPFALSSHMFVDYITNILVNWYC